MSQITAITTCPVIPTCNVYTVLTSGIVEYTNCAGTYVIEYRYTAEGQCAQNVISGDWSGAGSVCT